MSLRKVIGGMLIILAVFGGLIGFQSSGLSGIIIGVIALPGGWLIMMAPVAVFYLLFEGVPPTWKTNRGEAE